MNAVTVLLGYAIVLSWLAPQLLSGRLTAGVAPRLTVAGWLTCVATAVLAWVSALTILVVAAAHSIITHTALTFCVETLGIAGAMRLSAEVATVLVAALLVACGAVAVGTGRRVLAGLLAVRRHNRAHAEAVRIVGRSAGPDGVVLIADERPTAYCVAARGRDTIVVTTSALGLLDTGELAAVIAHERTHLRGRHHHIVAVLTALAAALPRLPLLREAERTVPGLLEMCADDAAVRRHGPAALVASLVTLAGHRPLPVTALAAAGTAVTARVQRLLQPTAPSRCNPRAVSLTLACGATLAAPLLAFTLCTL